MITALVLVTAGLLRSLREQCVPVVTIAVLGIAVSRPIIFFGEAQYATHAGIAPAFPVMYSSVVVAIVVFIGTRNGSVGLSSAVIFVWLALVWVFIFVGSENTSAQWAGFLSLCVAALCFACGRKLHVFFSSPDGPAAFALAIFLFVGLQFLVGIMQIAGILILEASDQGLMRVRGTFGHAGDLGKVLIAATALALACLAFSQDKKTRRLVVGTVGLAFLATAMTASRSNLAGLVVLLVAWALLARENYEKRLGRRFLFLGAAASLPFAGTYLLRFSADPDGGSRPELLNAAIQQIEQSPIDGTGLNSYVQVVGMWDARTASGLPVHNSFLLLAVELGLPLFAMMVAGAVALVARVGWHRSSAVGDSRAAFLAYALALFLLGLTGWGLLKVTVLPFMAFVAGLLVTPRENKHASEPIRGAAWDQTSRQSR